MQGSSTNQKPGQPGTTQRETTMLMHHSQKHRKRMQAKEDLRFAKRKIAQLKELSKARNVSVELEHWEAIAERKRQEIASNGG